MAFFLQNTTRVASLHVTRVPMFASQTRSMANLKELKIRMASVDSIKKITASMKLVAAAKMKAAEDRMHRVRPFFRASNSFLDERVTTASEEPAADKKHLLVLLTSDRGLCGAINSSLARVSKEIIRNKPNTEIVILGEKGKAALSRDYNKRFILTASELGKRQLNFVDFEDVAEKVSSVEFESATVLSNKFISVISFETLTNKLQSADFWKQRADLSEFELEDERPVIMQNLFEYSISTLLYSALTENSATELSARMTSMDNATKNAGEMLNILTLSYNRKRQAGITTELSEIIAGTEAIQDVD